MASWQELKIVLMLDIEIGARDIKAYAKDPFVKEILHPYVLMQLWFLVSSLVGWWTHDWDWAKHKTLSPYTFWFKKWKNLHSSSECPELEVEVRFVFHLNHELWDTGKRYLSATFHIMWRKCVCLRTGVAMMFEETEACREEIWMEGKQGLLGA